MSITLASKLEERALPKKAMAIQPALVEFGHAIIDHQHQNIFSLGAEIEALSRRNRRSKQLIRHLYEYWCIIGDHFTTEEVLLLELPKTRYEQQISSHIVMHNDILMLINQAISHLEDGLDLVDIRQIILYAFNGFRYNTALYDAQLAFALRDEKII
ncbi:MAG TPA: hypothetical protein HPP80_05735 [Rhodospirillaceae bacterium]|nr:hypothetical protein [Rhodospirillaceae bacterium]